MVISRDAISMDQTTAYTQEIRVLALSIYQHATTYMAQYHFIIG